MARDDRVCLSEGGSSLLFLGTDQITAGLALSEGGAASRQTGRILCEDNQKTAGCK